MRPLGYAVFSAPESAERFRDDLTRDERLRAERIRLHRQRLDPELTAELVRPRHPRVANRRFLRHFALSLLGGVATGAAVEWLVADVGAPVYGLLLGGALGTVAGGVALVLGNRRQRAARRMSAAAERGDVLVTVQAPDDGLDHARRLAERHGTRIRVVT